MIGFRKIIIGAVFLVNANVIYFLSNTSDKLGVFFNFLIFLAGIIIAGNVGEHFADKINHE